jgi:catechol 2,3-dioxygenase-like lactoylglutathione lyase family enzyme
MERGPYSSIYLRDPDGHLVELAAGAGELVEE